MSTQDELHQQLFEFIYGLLPEEEAARMNDRITSEPEVARASSQLEFAPIPVNRYQGSLSDELSSGRLQRADLLNIQRDDLQRRALTARLTVLRSLARMP